MQKVMFIFMDGHVINSRTKEVRPQIYHILANKQGTVLLLCLPQLSL